MDEDDKTILCASLAGIRDGLCLWGVVGLVVFLVYYFLVPRASMPTFVLRDVTVYEFSATSPPSGQPGPSYLNTTMQVTLSCRNPPRGFGIFNYTLGAYASYHNQQITPSSFLEPGAAYQGHKNAVEWSPFLKGKIVPVSPGALAHDLTAGTVPIDVSLKWDNYLHVNCPVLLMLNTSGAATGSGLPIKVQSAQHCTVSAT